MALIIKLEDAEVTEMPQMVFYRISVRDVGNSARTHHVMKRLSDVQAFHRSLSHELSFRSNLPSPPTPISPDEEAQYGFQARVDAYLEALTQTLPIVATFSFRNFFQLPDEHHRYAALESKPKCQQVEQGMTTTSRGCNLSNTGESADEAALDCMQ